MTAVHFLLKPIIFAGLVYFLATSTNTGCAQELYDFAQLKTLYDKGPAEQHAASVLLARNGRYREAVYILQYILKIDESMVSEQLLYDYIAILDWAGQSEQAIDVFRKQDLTLRNNIPKYVKEALANSFYQTGDYRTALFFYQQEPTDKDRLNAEKCLIFLGEFSLNDASVDTQKGFALDLAHRGRLSEASGIYKKLLLRNLLTIYDIYDYVTILHWEGKDKEALELFNRKTAGGNLPDYIKKILGDIYLKQNNVEKARGFYLAGSQSDVNCKISLADLYVREGNFTAAFLLLDDIIRENPNQPDAYIQCAKSYLNAGFIFEAAQNYDRALRIIPADYLEYRRYVQAEQAAFFMRAGEYAYSIRILSPYIKNKQASQIMQCDYILALKNYGTYKAAIKAAEELWTDLEKVPAYGLMAAGDACMQAGDREKALKYYIAVTKSSAPERQAAFEKIEMIGKG